MGEVVSQHFSVRGEMLQLWYRIEHVAFQYMSACVRFYVISVWSAVQLASPVLSGGLHIIYRHLNWLLCVVLWGWICAWVWFVWLRRRRVETGIATTCDGHGDHVVYLAAYFLEYPMPSPRLTHNTIGVGTAVTFLRPCLGEGANRRDLYKPGLTLQT